MKRFAGRRCAVLAPAVLACAVAWTSLDAVPLSDDEIAKLCDEAEDEAHCGRLIEAAQLRRLPGLAQRNGNTLTVTLYPSGSARFVDGDDPVNGTSYSLWEYLDPINTVVLFTTRGERTTFTLVQRPTNARTEVPSEPVVAPDRQRLVTADFCDGCTNELAVWRIAPDGVKKALAWSPPTAWTGAVASWKDGTTLVIDYTAGAAPQQVVRKLDDPSWRRVNP